MHRRTIEVALPLDDAVVLARRVAQLDANPGARREERLSEESHCRQPAVRELDGLAGDVRRRRHGGR